MIEYSRGPYGANLLFRWHGSALAKAFIPGLVSVAIYLALHYLAHYDDGSANGDDDEYLNHPYAIGVLVSSVSFLIIFRANYGYQRYWEACTAVHKLMSKWQDATSLASVFHLQSEHYKDMRPPSFFNYDELNQMDLTRDRERESTAHCHIIAASSEDCLDPEGEDSMRSESSKYLRRRRYSKSINRTTSTRRFNRTDSQVANESCDETHLLGPPRLDGGWGMLYPNQINGNPTSTHYDIPKVEKETLFKGG